MPKDEFDFEDPLELNGMALLTKEDTTDAMCECFIEEFMRMGYSAEAILTLFRNSHYLGMNMVLEKRGEQFVCGCITDTYARWGRPANLPALDSQTAGQKPAAPEPPPDGHAVQPIKLDNTLTDPMGAPVPNLNL
jgi:hypothetical protein